MSTILHLSDLRNYFLYRKETDMLKGFDSLCGIISGELARQVTGGDAFIFINRPRTHLKLLLWEGDGFTTAAWRKAPLKYLNLILIKVAFRSRLISSILF